MLFYQYLQNHSGIGALIALLLTVASVRVWLMIVIAIDRLPACYTSAYTAIGGDRRRALPEYLSCKGTLC
ncbi:MAG: hypothetical protein JWQ98_360 [Chlorobi bacterium]|nr:hypothetical protein [Chlorobiota bacterium]